MSSRTRARGNTAVAARAPSTAKRNQPRGQMRGRATPAATPAVTPAPPVAPRTVAQLRQEAAFWDQHFPRVTQDGQGEAQASEAHVAMVKGLSAQLKGNRAWSKLVKDSHMTGYAVPAMPEFGIKGYRFTPSDQMVANLVSEWGDDVSAAMHLAARAEFGFTGDHLVGGGRSASDPQVNAYAHETMRQYGGAMRAFLRANYNATQDWFKAHNISEVTLYRGRKWGGEGTREKKPPAGITFNMKAEQHPVELSPISSFATNPETARMFTHTWGPSDYRSLVMTRVPVADILSMPLTGLGRMDEHEMLVLGGKTRPSATVSWLKSEHGDSSTKALLPILARASRLTGRAARGSARGSAGVRKSKTPLPLPAMPPTTEPNPPAA